MENKEHPESQKPRKRARGMSLEDRRAMIVRAALPLLTEVGPGVTTLQMARAAGISEPTIFRAFADKNEVLMACLEEATRPERVTIELEAIDSEADLEERLAELIEIIRTRSERTGAVLNAIRLAAQSGAREGAIRRSEVFQRWQSNYAVIHAAVCDVLRPDETRLRLSVEEMATLVLTIVLSLGQSGGWNAGMPNITPRQMAELLLHGAMQ